MLQKIISYSVKNKLIVAFGVLALIIGGVWQLTKLPIDAVPDITDNQVQVITVVPSLGAPDVERLITVPIEQGTRNIGGLQSMRSFSRFGLSIVTLVFNEDVDVYWARQQVSERLVVVQQQLPPGLAVPSMAPITTGLGEIYQYVLRPAPGYEVRYSPTELRTLQDFVVRRQLRGVQGVADVSSYGGFQKQYEVALNPDKMRQLHIGLNDVFSALQQENNNAGGTYIEKGMQALFIRTEGLLKSISEIENIVIKRFSSSQIITVKDIATVQEGKATRYGALCYNDQGEVAGAVVMMVKGGNSSEVIKNVKIKIAEIQQMLPKGVIIEPFLDRTKMVNNAISTVEKNLAEGALIVVFVLVLVLGNLRAGLIVASVIPLAMLFAVIMMNVFGVSGNLMSLGALDFGLIIDGAVIIVESILHQLWKRDLLGTYSKEQRETLVVENAGKMMNSAVFGQLIILVVYLPIFSLQGIEGKMFTPMAQTVAFALVGAFLLSLTYVPMMCSQFIPLIPGKFQAKSEEVIHAVELWFIPRLRWAMHHFKLLISVAIVLLIISVYGLMQLGGEFIPELEEGDFAADTRILTGSSVKATVEATQRASELLLKSYPEIEKIVTKIGNGEIPTDPMPMEASDLMIILKDKKEWTSADNYDELAEKMSKTVSVIPGLSIGFQYPVQMRFNELMTGAKQDVVCKVYGDNMDTLAKIAKIIGHKVSGIDGAKDIYVEQVVGQPQVLVTLNRDKMKVMGLRTDEINRLVEASFSGAVAGKIYEGERPFDLVVRIDEGNRNSLEDIQEMPITLENGDVIPLSSVAEVKLINGPNQIQRENAQRRIMIGFNVRGRDVESVVKDLQFKLKKFALPTGYWIQYGGSFENLQRARTRLMLAIPAALLLIGILLYFAFNSIAIAILVFSAIPLSLIGGIVGLVLRDMPFSISAGIGMIALFGVAVLNGIVLVAEFKRQELENPNLDRESLIVQSTAKRLRPVLMTALVAALGFMPMALSTGAGAEVQKPLATVVIGGLITATLLTLLLLPSMYLLISNSNSSPKKSNTEGSDSTDNSDSTESLDLTNNSDFMNNSNSPKNATTFTTILLLMAISITSQGFAAVSRINKTISLKGKGEFGVTEDSLLFSLMDLRAVKRLDLPSAIALGKENNKGLQIAQWKEKASAAQGSYKLSAPAAVITADLGQVNSWYGDQKYGINQTLFLPAWYRADYQRRQQIAAEFSREKELIELRWEVSVKQLYRKLELAQWQCQLLNSLVEISELSVQKMRDRLKLGDVSQMDYNQMQNVHEQLLMQRSNFLTLLVNDAIQLGWLLGESSAVIPVDFNLLPTNSENGLPQLYIDSRLQGLVNSVVELTNENGNATEIAAGNNHPWLRLELARAERMDWEWRQAKSMVYPQVQVGFVKQSFQGFIQLPQGDVFYDKKPQFSQWQIGLQVPLFTAAVRQEANSKELLWKAQVLQAEFSKLEIDAEYNKLNQQKNNLIGQLARYQNTLLPNSVQSFDIANFQLSVGAISVFQWELLVRGLTQNYLDYFGSIQDLSVTQLMLKYYKSN